MAVSYSAGSAEQAFGGVQMNLIPREGGNVFKGSLFATGVNARFQGSNYTEELKAAGLRTPNSIKLVYDVNPGVGGPIVEGQAVVLLRRPLADDADLSSPACTRTRTRATPPSGPTTRPEPPGGPSA